MDATGVAKRTDISMSSDRKFKRGDCVRVVSTGKRGIVTHYSYGQVVVKIRKSDGLHKRMYLYENELDLANGTNG